MRELYFDHAASTPLHPEVLEAMVEAMRGPASNASSVHRFGRSAMDKLSSARDQIASQLGCRSSELVFTSGGTESDNAALTGVMRALRSSGKTHLITTAIEHHAILHTCEALQAEGISVTIVKPDDYGRIHAVAIEEAITPETGLISVMYGNNEVGTLQPIEEIANLAQQHGIYLHTDAVQALGHVPIDLSASGISLMSLSAHKINGPQGVGALYIAKGTPFQALQFGGSQERKRRAGTENTAGIIGFAKAVTLAISHLEDHSRQLDQLRDTWISLLKAELGADAIAVNGHPQHHLPHIANISFLGIQTESMLMNLDLSGIAASSGSACTSGSLERSHVLLAMGLDDARLESAVRFSFGLGNTTEQLEYAAQKIGTIVRRIRSI